MGFKPMTRAQITAVETSVKNLKAAYKASSRPTGFSSGTGMPGAFGLVTTASPPGPYFGSTDQVSAYAFNGPGGGNCLAADPNCFILLQNGQSPTAQIGTVEISPGGSCIITSVVYTNFLNLFITNNYNFIDECATPTVGFIGNLNQTNGFWNTYVNHTSSNEPPHIGEWVVQDQGRNIDNDVDWHLFLFNNNTQAYDNFYDTDAGASNGNVDGNFGGFFWVAEPEQAGPCVPIKPEGIGIQNIALVNPTPGGNLGGVSVPLAQSMPGGTFTGFDAPPTNLLRCFRNDNTGVGNVYVINNGSVFPNGFYNTEGGQLLVTSHP